MIKTHVHKIGKRGFDSLDDKRKWCAYLVIEGYDRIFGYQEYEREDYAWTHVQNLKEMCECVRTKTQKQLREVLGMEK